MTTMLETVGDVATSPARLHELDHAAAVTAGTSETWITPTAAPAEVRL